MAEIADGLRIRLEKIRSSNGYGTNVSNVYYDNIPMGLELEPSELPAILMLASDNMMKRTAFQIADCQWSFLLQLIHGDVSDDVMWTFVGDIARVIYADSPSADAQNRYKEIHPALYDLEMTRIEPDINMIEANRFAIVELVLRFKTKIINL